MITVLAFGVGLTASYWAVTDFYAGHYFNAAVMTVCALINIYIWIDNLRCSECGHYHP